MLPERPRFSEVMRNTLPGVVPSTLSTHASCGHHFLVLVILHVAMCFSMLLVFSPLIWIMVAQKGVARNAW